MGLHELYRRWMGRLQMARRRGARLAPPRGMRLMVERLEDRALPSTWTAPAAPVLSGHGQPANQVDATVIRRNNEGVLRMANGAADGQSIVSPDAGRGHRTNGGLPPTGLYPPPPP
jgi:hypothetical protein